MNVIKPPSKLDKEYKFPSIFLGGTIDQGNSFDWQKEIEKIFEESNVTIFNPRRDDWDPIWKQDPTPGTQFHTQVTWELEAQDKANFLFYVFLEDSKSPITFLELGIYHSSPGKYLKVFCPKKFYRYGNIKIVCEKYGIEHFENIEEFNESCEELAEIFLPNDFLVPDDN